MKITISDIVALGSIVVTILTLITTNNRNKKQLAAQLITANRMDWIKQVRSLLSEFACEYIKKDCDKEKLFAIKTQTELYMRRFGDSVQDYVDLLDQMELCCKEDFSEQRYRLLMLCASYVLRRVWARISLEGRGKVLLNNHKIIRLLEEEETAAYQSKKHDIMKQYSPDETVCFDFNKLEQTKSVQ